MKISKLLLLSSFCFICMMSCKSKKDVMIYSNNDYENVNMENNLKSNITINYKLHKQGIKDTFNLIIDEFLATDMALTDLDLDVKLSKKEDADIEFEGKKVLVTLPVAIYLEKETFFSTMTATGVLNMIFMSDLEVDSSWNLITNSQLSNYEWIEEPKLNLGLVALPIEKIANSVIEKSKSELAKTIDDSIKEQFNLKNRMHEILSYVEEPYLIDSLVKMYVTLEPEMVQLSRTWNKEVWTEGQIGMSLNTRMSEAKPKLVAGIKLPAFQWNDDIDTSSTLSLQMAIDYKHVQTIIDKNFIGKTFVNDGKEITINDVELKGFKEKVEVVADVSGSFNGTLVMRGKPVFNNEDKVIEVEDLDIKIKTNNILQKAGAWLFKGKIKNSMKQQMRFSVAENISLAQENIDSYLEKINKPGAIEIDLQLGDSVINDLLIAKDQIFVGIDLNLKIDALIYDFFEFQNLSRTIPNFKN